MKVLWPRFILICFGAIKCFLLILELFSQCQSLYLPNQGTYTNESFEQGRFIFKFSFAAKNHLTTRLVSIYKFCNKSSCYCI